MDHALQTRFVPGRYAVSRLPADADLPGWMNGPGFKAVITSDDETTIVCLEDRVPAHVTSERGWACLRTIGPFPFDASGIVLSLIEPLSANDIGVFVVCTYDGEHVLVSNSDAEKAVQCLEAAGHVCIG
ncbi:ACT domain-containing protein [Salipiger pallidus]|uniref:ACT domain-containing protein n=1 Tax=Salipiger pallidus TaxID=1775170 RepID=A0A8J2ZGB5_9RHOB|nr:ACT domain-containing protein [Salipiger pallidus]GGG59909.1 ACT domain-containing protein [Salipiger pallidus]